MHETLITNNNLLRKEAKAWRERRNVCYVSGQDCLATGKGGCYTGLLQSLAFYMKKNTNSYLKSKLLDEF